MKRILILGNGGREHALGWKLLQNPKVEQIYFSPGNAGTNEMIKSQNVPLSIESIQDFQHCYDWMLQEKIEAVIVGSEFPLSLGWVDYLHEKGFFHIWGHTQKAAELETNKSFSFQLMEQLGIPQAHSIVCSTPFEIQQAIQQVANPSGVVLKTVGLASGKGVFVFSELHEAMRGVPDFVRKLGAKCLVAERLVGEEFSIFALVYGERVEMIPMAFRDYKTINEGDMGRNTGGMGCYAPVSFVSLADLQHIHKTILQPIATEMKNRKTPLTGFLYAGMIQTKDGFRVLEFNVRFGDPECQVAMILMKDDLLEWIETMFCNPTNKTSPIAMEPLFATCVVVSSKDYPDKKNPDLSISSFPSSKEESSEAIFQGSTYWDEQQLYARSGRVAGFTVREETLELSRQKAYEWIDSWSENDRFYFRKDIAKGK